MRLRLEHFINQLKLILTLFFVWVFALGYITISFGLCEHSSRPTPFPNQRKIIAQTLAFREKWRVQLGGISGNEQPNMLSTQYGLVFANQFGNHMTSDLILLHHQDGHVIWQHSLLEFPVSIVTDNEKLYLVVNRIIEAYNLIDGQMIWHTQQQEGHTKYSLYFKNGFLYENASFFGDNTIHKFDPNTGTELDNYPTPFKQGYNYIPLNNIDLYNKNNILFGVKANTDELLWQTQITSDNSLRKPVVIDRFLVTVLSDEARLMILDYHTGQILWTKPNVVSNAIVVKNIVYTILQDASIRAYQLETGRETGFITMNNPPTFDIGNNGNYILVADEANNTIYTAYKDSQEIIAFSLSRTW